jgi:hypothetical protein
MLIDLRLGIDWARDKSFLSTVADNKQLSDLKFLYGLAL